MSRLLLIATREYLSFLRTPGFWLSLLIAPLMGTLGGVAPRLLAHAAPAQTLSIVDFSGAGLGEPVGSALQQRHIRLVAADLRATAASAGGPDASRAVGEAFATGGEAAARAKLAEVAPKKAASYRTPADDILLTAPPADVASATTPAAAGAALKPYIAGSRLLPGGKRLDAAAVISRGPTGLVVDLWSKGLTDSSLQETMREAVGDADRHQRLLAAGVSPQTIQSIELASPRVRGFIPTKAGQISLRDRLPSYVGFGLAFLLWAVILTSTTLLLNSVIEEKSNRVLEVLLSSASVPEILGGKILGVAGLAATVMAVWGVMGAAALNRFLPGMTGDIWAALLANGMLAYFALYFIGGYLMYAAIFAAIGSFCETTREAQSLLGPVMILLTIPMIFMSTAITRPDAPLLSALSWIPPFTPFLMTARAGSGPPGWQVAGTMILMFATAAAVVWLSARAFRAGALSTAKLDPKRLVSSLLKAGRA